MHLEKQWSNVEHELHHKLRDPQKRSKGSCIWLEKIMIVVDKVVAVER